MLRHGPFFYTLFIAFVGYDEAFRGRKALSKVSTACLSGGGKPESGKKPPVSSPKTPTFVQRKHSSGKNSAIFLADS